MSGTRISVDTELVRGLAEAVERAEAEARAVLDAPDLLRGSIAAMSAGVGGSGASTGAAGALARAGEEFVQAWHQVLADAVDELDLFSVALDLAAQLYDTTQRVGADRHGITLTGAIR